MHKSKVTSAVLGVLIVLFGAIQGMALGGVFGPELYESPPFLSGLIGGLIPVTSGVLGTLLLMWGYSEPCEEIENK